ncbi:MAG: GNAT family N-acetyltransferase [Dehalococcoidia bacterium]|jgi:GNAT superfamily N-acetyltransferase|nr:GNAT family N-acetyltransferase [Dehalococcoidia bacterium]
MKTSLRAYDHALDYERVGQFLVETYRESGKHINWLQARWEYMNFHPFVRVLDLSRIGLWESGGQIVGAVHPEDPEGGVYFELHPDFGDLRAEMLEYAEAHLALDNDGVKRMRVFINDLDEELQGIAADRGYAMDGSAEPMTRFDIADEIPAHPIPDGYRVSNLTLDGDAVKESRLFWRGFNHGDEPPGDGREDREFMRSAPNFDTDLNIVVVAPDGTLASYCGTWMDPVNHVAYVEPVCTDPDHRRLGLASAAVLAGIRRCAERGATVAFVGSDQPAYLSMGFAPHHRTSAWAREWS